jgi:hypothetical protein
MPKTSNIGEFLCPKTALNSSLKTEVAEKIDLGSKRL